MTTTHFFDKINWIPICTNVENELEHARLVKYRVILIFNFPIITTGHQLLSRYTPAYLCLYHNRYINSQFDYENIINDGTEQFLLKLYQLDTIAASFSWMHSLPSN